MKLDRLIRYQHMLVEQQRLSLMPLKTRIETLDHEISLLEQHIISERRAALESVDGAIAYGHYVQNINIRLSQVRKFLVEARLKLNQELDKLQDLAAQQKVYERVRNNNQAKDDLQSQKQQQEHMDDMIAIHHE